ncbi:hypothetical protein CDD81_8084 [Ophiocordyceps australis]|uniref:Microbial-type PARG catalytic domain-containing protein n=1 Tax=Ophiocordyceps australis TaxID=1399860 RepID=A0A2C5Y1Z8_9HYPO|nr:hypothetical protein CDD81_8084 [Ophiocordyceps australis]
MSRQWCPTTLLGWVVDLVCRAFPADKGLNSAVKQTRHNINSNRRYRRDKRLAATAKETLAVLPEILAQLPDIDAHGAEACFLDQLPRLDALHCPRKQATAVCVVNKDSLNAALELAAKYDGSSRVAVLNMANFRRPGGGWLQGARAQEETLCYRSSLVLSLDKRFYPWRQHMALYTRDVVVVRGDIQSGHGLLPGASGSVEASSLPKISVVSVAALQKPRLCQVENQVSYLKDATRELTKAKMRLCLRIAALRGHTLLVLGALGCGAFGHPATEVAQCWRRVLQEDEFAGGWWQAVWFAVLDERDNGLGTVFSRELAGLEV